MKRLVICADGTWNVRDSLDKVTGKRRPTNVTKVARAVLPRAGQVDQIVFYHEGVGTAGGLDKFTGGAFGDGVEKNVRDLYRSILYNYQPGDELFLFGFSRGAFTIRTLVGFLNKIGLLQKGDDYWLPEAYSCYQKAKGPNTPEWQQVFHRLEQPPLPCPPFKFVGVWDTVGALGAPGAIGQILNRNKYEYHDISLNVNILNAYQALAIDEHRKAFLPSVWQKPNGWTGTLEQAWFAGAHSDVGGSETPDGLANEALHWLVEKAENLGLGFDNSFLQHYRPCFNATLHDSMSTMYRLMGPVTRTIASAASTAEALHQAVLDRRSLKDCNYDPPNVREFESRHPSTACYNTLRVQRGVAC